MNDIGQEYSENQSDDHLQLETSVIIEKKDVTQSVTDLYGVNVFTTEYKKQIEEYNANKSNLLAQEMVFTNQEMNSNENFAVENYLFQASSSVWKENDTTNSNDISGHFVLEFAFMICLLFVFTFLYKSIRRKNKNDFYNTKSFIRKKNV